MKVERALVSVSDKSGVVDFCRGLAERGIEIVSSGGTAGVLSDEGVPVVAVADVTGAPEILEGRVKTLHPKIHGGILADRRKPQHMRQLDDYGIEPIDLVVCNLYPFERTILQPGVEEDEALEQIDIGGPAMVRAAAKNWPSIAVVVNPDRYAEVLSAIASNGGVSDEMRRALAIEAFEHTAAYDSAISSYFATGSAYPTRSAIELEKIDDLRYGENPHQTAAFFRTAGAAEGIAASQQLHGKELSYNNILDSDAAWRLALELEAPAVAIVKHSNPCGVAVRATLSDAYARALDCDRTSAFGGIVAMNSPCDVTTAAAILEIFTEVVIAPDFDDAALELLTTKKNLRLLRAPTADASGLDRRSVWGGMLVQTADPPDRAEDAKVVTAAQPTDEQWSDLRFAWVVAKHVKSNAIVFAKDLAAVGVGAGQMSRVDSTELAARRAGDEAFGSSCASDAFFPFRDGLDAAVAAGARAVIQPGGSVRDDEVIAAADEHGIPMVFTGRRHFRH
jgi:phosphoribosylaminoimidazolecarboxamide formyltransferase / IMP cyclohydrolase